MASPNIYKADYSYGQVAALDMEDQLRHNKTPPFRRSSTTAILAASALFILLIIAVTLAIVFGTSSSSSSQPHQLYSSDTSIRLVCNVTRHPESCISTISSLNASPTPDPEQILNLSIRVCFNQLLSTASSLNISASDAVAECVELYDDARGRIGDAMEAMEPGLTEGKVNDVQTWLSAALTDEETCLDGLEEMREELDKVKFEEFKVNAEKLKEYLSNSLAIVANLNSLLQKFGLKLH